MRRMAQKWRTQFGEIEGKKTTVLCHEKSWRWSTESFCKVCTPLLQVFCFFFLLSSELFINIFVTIKALVTRRLIPKMGIEKWSFKKIRDRNEQKKERKPSWLFYCGFFLAGVLEPVVPWVVDVVVYITQLRLVFWRTSKFNVLGMDRGPFSCLSRTLYQQGLSLTPNQECGLVGEHATLRC